MERNGNVAQEALKYLDNAQNLEESGKLEDAIENYLTAAEYLKKSGYVLTRIDEIYERVDELKRYIKKEKELRRAKLNSELEQLQERAFSLLDAASNFEKKGQFNEAITQYNSAINLLVNAGWSDMQLANLREKLRNLSGKIAQTRVQKEAIQATPEKKLVDPSEVQVVSAFGKKKDAEKTEELRRFKESRSKQEQIQTDAFKFIDNAKFYEQDRKYGKAIESYRNAIELLNSVGWKDQTSQLESVVAKLEIEKRNYEAYEQSKKLKSGGIEYIDDTLEKKEKQFQESVHKLEKKKLDEDKVQSKAFALIDNGKRLEKENQYEKALSCYQEAIDLFNSIGWDSYIQPVRNLIKDIKAKVEQDTKYANLKKKRENELEKVRNTIYYKEQEERRQTQKEIETRRLRHETRRKEQEQKEQEFFTILDKADEFLKNNNFDEAINTYRNALGFLKTLGAGWESYKNTIDATIANVENLKEEYYKKELETKKRLERQQLGNAEFQKQINDFLAQERLRIQKSEATFQQKEEELEQKERKRRRAFEILEKAQREVNLGELDDAILSYQKVANLFAEIQWTDEIPMIENSIRELQIKKQKIDQFKKEAMEKSIRMAKEEQAFQEEITKQLELERQKIKEKEISLRVREQEKILLEKRKQETFNILDEAQQHVSNGDYEKAIEKYNDAVKIMSEIQWYDGIDFIQNSILDVEKQRIEAQRKEEEDLRAQLKREQEEREFREQLIKQTHAQQEKLRSRQIMLRKRDEEMVHREQVRKKAFSLIDQAQDYVSMTKFDEAIDLYHKVAGMFAQIQWQDELHLINRAINEIERKKIEKEKWKRKKIEDALKRENEYKNYISQIRLQREKEQEKIQRERELTEVKIILEEEKSRKQELAFNNIEKADDLIKREEFEQAINLYNQAKESLAKIGWKASYLTLLDETIQFATLKKKEAEKRKEIEKATIKKQLEEQRIFEDRLKEEMAIEQERLKKKKIEIQKREVLSKLMEKRRKKAFEIMSEAELMLNKGSYEDSLKQYRDAELILNEINFPTDAVREMIERIQLKIQERSLSRQREIKHRIKKEEEDRKFKEKIKEANRRRQQELRKKEIIQKKDQELRHYIEKRKEEAFDILDNAEIYMKEGAYEKALEFYRSAEVILNEIQYPTFSIKEMIQKVLKIQREKELSVFNELKASLKKQEEQKAFKQKLAESLMKERHRLASKKIEIQQKAFQASIIEKKKENAFDLLDRAKVLIEKEKYTEALELYRKSMLLLKEIQFPTASLEDMIRKITIKKKEKAERVELEYQQKLNKIKQKRQAELMIQERKRREREEKLAREQALKKRQELIQEQLSHREAAYSLLEEASKFLKKTPPDYDQAISLYIQARDLLSEKIGWEPEINNINMLIKDLDREKASYIERKKLEEQLRIKRQKEYDLFQSEIKKRKEEHERQKAIQEQKLRELKVSKQRTEMIKQQGLSFIDEGKKNVIKHNFKDALRAFNDAITKFNQIGWKEQTKYIEKEIENTKLLEKKAQEDQIRYKKIREELQKKRKQEEILTRKRERELRSTISDVSNLTGDLAKVIKAKKKEIQEKAKKEREKNKKDARDYRKTMTEMIMLKQEIMDEMKKTDSLMKKEQEKYKLAKDREKAEEIKKMLKDISKEKD